MLTDITDYLDVPAKDEALAKLNLLDKFEDLKAKGQLRAAAELLEESCKEPHIFHGHYKRLFMAWRQLNKEDLEACNYKDVIERVIKTIKLNDEMLTEMSTYWSKEHGIRRTKSYFSKYSHIKISDGRTLLKAATATQEKRAIKIAEKLINSFNKEKK
ncbi:hypothetical protein E0H89_03490 [Acinetobacter sp. ANC 3781]|uniref:hypothetical protein n=1 Tax=Acinetobacter sp. ANC 3781 TaxID=2529835 RepID=UPI0010402612|nr:hypothetical protein [Acinetobacter sp. ANC 3781]TCB79330.1 hypothetical protein E0H89_03490 [Acinetobacter sp. ANC 3781]